MSDPYFEPVTGEEETKIAMVTYQATESTGGMVGNKYYTTATVNGEEKLARVVFPMGGINPPTAGEVGQALYRGPSGSVWVDDVINVKAYGAAGDGITDDTAVLQGLIDELSASGGGTMLFPKGHYRANLVLKSGVTLMGLRGHFGYIGSTAISPIRIQGVTTAAVIDTPSDTACSQAAVIGIDIQGASEATVGIHFRDTNWCAIKQVHLTGFQDQAILLDSTSIACVIEDILAFNSLMNRTRAGTSGVVEIDGTDHFLSRIEANASLNGITSANLYCAGIYLKGANHFVSNVIGEISDRGIVVACTRSRFANCRGDLNWGHDWEITGSSNSFTSCIALSGGRGATNTYDGFKVSGVANLFAACATSQAGGDRYKYGIEDTVNTGAPFQHNQYVACRTGGFATAAYSTVGFLGSIIITGNRAIRPADAATTWDVTGAGIVSLGSYATPTTITAFTGGVSGQELTVIGNPEVTIQNNATIKTNTGADLTLVINRAYKFINYNGVWYQV